MKIIVSTTRLFAVVCLALALDHSAPAVLAQVLPKREVLPNTDKRLEKQNRVWMAADKEQALTKLRGRLPDLQADIDPLLKSPTFISSRKGFLTGANGTGVSVSSEGAKGIPENDPHRAIKTFLNEHSAVFGHGAEVLSDTKVKREFVSAHNGLKTTVWQQELDGIPVFEALLVGHITRNGELVNLSTHFLPEVSKAADAGTPNRRAMQNSPIVSASQAIVSAAKDIGSEIVLSQITAVGSAEGATKKQRFGANAALNGNTFVELVWLPTSESSMRLCWQVLLTSRARGEMFQSIVDAQTGEVMVRHGLTEYISDATYNVYTSDSPSPFSPGHQTPSPAQPPLIPRVLITTNALSVVASPNGWINDGGTETLGNNVDAHLDANDDDQPDLPRPNGGTNRVFNFALDLTKSPTNYSDAAVVQLFYWCNWYHDKVYELGFTEAAGNFQTDNFGRGGIGGDPVLADAQDGINLNDPFHDNNANMATPPDGFSPRMQMYKFSGPTPDRDGDLDAEVILHEHTHGLSNRRVGGGVGLFNLQSRGMGEGWSDFYALTLLSESSDNINAAYANGGYVTRDLFGLAENYYYGIRRYPYSTDMTKSPLTFKDIDPGQASSHPGVPTSPIFVGSPADEVHNQGEVWCAALWEARAQLINKYGYAIGNQLILQLVTDGMNLTPPNPNFVQARDGILAADLVNNAGANRDQLWAAFAKRGLGALASSPISTTSAGVIESFDVPGLAISSTSISGGNGNGIIDFNECNNLDIVLTNIGIAASNITVALTTTTPEVIIAQSLSTYPNIPGGGTALNVLPLKISTSPNFVCGTPVDLTLVIKSDVDTRTNLFRLPSGVIGLPVRFDNTTTVAIPDADLAGTNSSIVVSNFSGTIGQVTVGLFLTHTFDADLLIQLIAPDGTTVNLSQNSGGAGDNFGSSCSPDTFRTRFDDSATVAISAGAPPFIGSFQPEQPLSTFNLKSGTNANGTWKLHVVDEAAVDIGAIQCWSLFLSPQSCTDGGGECPGSDLGVTMSAAPDPVASSSNLTYTITVTNHGPSTAKTVILNQTLPSGVTFVSATNSQGNVSQSGGVVTCNFGKISARGSANLKVIVVPAVTGTISSTVTVSSEQADPDTSNNSVTVLTRVVAPSADLGVTISDSPDPVGIGTLLTYKVTVTNHGPISATGIKVTNNLPSTAAFVSATSTQGSFINAGGTIIYSLGTLTNGGGAVITIVVRPTVVGNISANSQVVGTEADLIPGNNLATATTTVTPACDLGLTVIATPNPAVTGSNINFILTITNRSSIPATNVVVNGTLPASASYITNIISQGTLSVNGNTFNAALGTLAGGGSATVTITVVAPAVPQNVTLSGNVSGGQGDPDLSNNNATVTVAVADPFVFITPAGSRLVVEAAPANGSIDIGETVSVELSLRNSGNVNTTNLSATLLSGNGVGSPSGSQNYGALVAGGQAVNRTFSFTATGTYGQTITATLRLQDGSGPVTNVNFTFALPSLSNFSNTNLITISNIGNAFPYPSQITVSNVTGLVSKVAVTLKKINHTYPDDIDALLVDPTGRKVLLMSDAGGASGLTDITLTLDPDAASQLSDIDQLVSGEFRPADYTDSPADFFPAPAPVGPYGTLLHSLDGTSPNGMWSLYIVDDTTGDAGNIAGGWSLAITTLAPVNKVAELAIAATNSSTSVLVNQDASYTFVITNNGPDAASSVVLSNTLPLGATFVSASLPVVVNGGVVICNFGNVASNSTPSVTIVIRPTIAGTLTNTATIFATENDVNFLNNSVTVTTGVSLPVADLGIALSATTAPVVGYDLNYTILVTNNGPNTAENVVVTNRLPSTVTFVSASLSQGTYSVAAGVITCTLGNIPAGSTASIIITTTPQSAGLITNVANIVTASNDPINGNNSASVVSSVTNPSPNIFASGSTLISESSPANGSVDSGETVTIAFALANLGTANTANLVATLQSTGGVTAPSGPQTYGVVVNGGSAVSRNFTFSASSSSTGTVTATLHLQDGATDLGNVTYVFDLPKTTNFANTASISIPSSGPATPYPSSMTVSGMSGLISRVKVSLNGLSHAFPDDLDIMLVGPTGQKIILMSDAGGAHALSGVNLTFDDFGAALSDSNQVFSGTYRPTDFEVGESLSPPAPAAPYSATLSILNGGSPNGTWFLYVNDDAAGDSGTISGGWNLAITTVNTVNPAANLSVIITDSPRPAYVDGHLNYTVTVSNNGPAFATGVVLTNTLPVGLTPTVTSLSQGDSVIGNPTSTFNFGILAPGSSATATFFVIPSAAGSIVNNVSVTANETDLYLGNNTAQTTTPVLIVTPARLSTVSMTDGAFQLTVAGEPGLSYRIDVSSNMTTWLPINTNTTLSNGMFKFTDTATSNCNPRFYRAVRIP